MKIKFLANPYFKGGQQEKIYHKKFYFKYGMIYQLKEKDYLNIMK